MAARLAMLLADVPMSLQSQLLRQMVGLHSRLPVESAHGADQARITDSHTATAPTVRYTADTATARRSNSSTLQQLDTATVTLQQLPYHSQSHCSYTATALTKSYPTP